MATATKAWEFTYGNTTLRRTKQYIGSAVNIIDGETVADGQTDQLIVFHVDVSACQAFYIVSDQAITVETNSGSSPADTLTLVAGRPYEWDSDSEDTFQLGTDVTGLYITNASGSTATIYAYAVLDATP